MCPRGLFYRSRPPQNRGSAIPDGGDRDLPAITIQPSGTVVPLHAMAGSSGWDWSINPKAL